MDIVINRSLEYQALQIFLQNEFPQLDFCLLYEGVKGWDDVQPQQAIFQYCVNADLEAGFNQSLSICLASEPLLPLIERLSERLSRYFDCATVCDATRIVLKENNFFYSLLFEDGKVFLVDDFRCEETGEVAKIVELAYETPDAYLTSALLP